MNPPEQDPPDPGPPETPDRREAEVAPEGAAVAPPAFPVPPIVAPSAYTLSGGAPAAPPFGSPVAPEPGSMVTPLPADPLNPWVAIWFRPRAAMRQILATDPRRLVHSLAVLGTTLSLLLGYVQPLALLPQTATGMLVFKIVTGILGGLLGLYLGAGLTTMTGRWLGGRGAFTEVRAASAWSCVPAIWSGLLLLPLVTFAGADGLNLDPQRMMGEPVSMALFFAVGAGRVTIGIWRFFTSLKCLAEAHRFSAWRAFGAVLLAIVIVAIPLGFLLAVLVGLAGAASLLPH